MALMDRAKNIMVTPKTEWDVAAAEPTQPKQLITSYVVPLAALAAIAGFISSVVVGTNVPMLGTVRASIAGGLVGAILAFVLAIAGVFVMGFIIDALAPTFGGTKSMPQAVKVAAYSYTPIWVLAIPAIIPYIGILITLVSIGFAVYLLYLGLPRLMRAPQEKAAGYTAVVIVVGIVVNLVIAMVVGLITAPFMAGAGIASTSSGFEAGSKGAQLEQYAKQMEEASKRMEAAQKSGDAGKQMEAAMGALGAALSGGKGVEPVQLDALKPLLPETFAGLPRTSQRADRSGVAGLMAAKVEGQYGSGDKTVNLEIVDTGGAAGLMGLAAWAAAGASSESETDQRIERMRRDGKRLVKEEISKTQGQNSYTVILADRFVVEAEGQGVDINALKSAVNGLDLAKIENLK